VKQKIRDRRSSPTTGQSVAGTVLFSPRSSGLRLRAEMPCSHAPLTGEPLGSRRNFHEEHPAEEQP